MQINSLGFTAAITAFLSIWIGHVAVRKIEFTSRTIWLPSVIAVILGLAIEYSSLIAISRVMSTILGILGITLLWDAFEFTRQQKRIVKGHAPANPNNPRHAKILAEHSSATKHDLLKRKPTGKAINANQD